MSATIRARTTAHYYPGGVQVNIKMIMDEPSNRVLGVQVIGPDKIVAGYIDIAAALIGKGGQQSMTSSSQTYHTHRQQPPSGIH
ncbi:hypothetical protein [Vulcanisaeta distributa]|uniref:hypothetical protein n=1 Tax=Vulcanisaeta distributa TaxID=164451 RepID=UPI001FB49CAD|nr:hypothetical protein [Vulcanisaeta distributa]